MLQAHGTAVEADLQRFYGVDLRWLLDGSRRLSWRRLSVLLRHLPRDAATTQQMLGEVARWGTVEHLLAALLDAAHTGNWLAVRVAGGKAPKPTPVRRPGDVPDDDARTVIAPARPRTPDEIAAIFAAAGESTQLTVTDPRR